MAIKNDNLLQPNNKAKSLQVRQYNALVNENKNKCADALVNLIGSVDKIKDVYNSQYIDFKKSLIIQHFINNGYLTPDGGIKWTTTQVNRIIEFIIKTRQ